MLKLKNNYKNIQTDNNYKKQIMNKIKYKKQIIYKYINKKIKKIDNYNRMGFNNKML